MLHSGQSKVWVGEWETFHGEGGRKKDFERSAIDGMSVFSQIHMLRPTPQDDGIWGGTFGRWVVIWESGALLSRLSALIRETPEGLSPPLPCEDTARSRLFMNWKKASQDAEYADSLTLDFPASRAVEYKFLLFTSHPVYSILLQQFKMTKTSLTWGMRGVKEIVKTLGIKRNFITQELGLWKAQWKDLGQRKQLVAV